MVQALYCPCIGVPAFIINNSIIAQWSSTASPSSPQRWTDLEDPDTLYAHAVLFSLTPLNLLNTVEGREQGNYGDDPALFVYSTVVIFIHPGQVLTTIQNTIGFFQHQYDAILQGGHSASWCTLCKLPHYEMSQYFPMIPHMPCLALPMSQPSGDPTVQPQLCLDSASCDADHMIIWLLHWDTLDGQGAFVFFEGSSGELPKWHAYSIPQQGGNQIQLRCFSQRACRQVWHR